MEEIRISEVVSAREGDVRAVNALLKQLTTSTIVLDLADLQKIVESEASRLFFIYYGDTVAGMLTIGSYLSPTGPKSWVEDVVVDEQFRGHSLGRKLMDFAIAESSKILHNQLMLTSKPRRVAANALYRSVGFQQKETNVYRMSFDE